MKTVKTFFKSTLLIFCVVLFSGSCSAVNTQAEISLVGSSPADELIKSILIIPAGQKVDFINWDLELTNKNTFVLNIVFGESQPNTLGFIGGGEKRTYKGTFSVSESSNFEEVYHLKSAGLSTEIRIAKLNENIFHLLTSQNQMITGNGGWSYSLNRKEPVDNDEISIPSAAIIKDRSLQVVYDGRTPCQEIANEHPQMKATSSCFKIKWRLTLNRDSITYQPTTCTIRNIVDNEPRDVSGKWEIIRGTATNPNAIIYKIKADNLAEPILLFVGDEHVLFFLDKNNKPMIGNKDFSFTMNKKT